MKKITVNVTQTVEITINGDSVGANSVLFQVR